jgi:16S rRNA G966 N2-methylase RsmD
MNCSFRNYWLPTASSSRRSPVNPMMPMPNTLFSRMEELCVKLRGVTGICSTVETQMFRANRYYDEFPSIYVDPPYVGTTAYGHEINNLNNIIPFSYWISEGKALSDEAVCLSEHRTKGGISGDRQSKNEEWLSYIRK